MEKIKAILDSLASYLNNLSSTNMIIGMVGKDITDAATINSTVPLFKDIYEIVAGAGLCLVAIFFVLSWIETMTYNEANMEQFVSLLLKGLTAMLFINIGFEFLQYIVQFGDAMVVSYMDKISTSTLSPSNVTFQDIDWFGIIAKLAMILPISIVVFAINVCSKFIVYTRFFEINLHLIMSPIAFANMFEEKRRNTGIKFFKKFMALCLQGLIMALIVIIGSELLSNESALTEMFSILTVIIGPATGSVGNILLMGAGTLLIELVKCSVIGFTLISLLFKSRSIANDVMGV